MAPASYQGPVSLASSRYASPHPAPPGFTTFPVASISSAIATKEQVAATLPASETPSAVNTMDPDAQLAVAQNLSLKEEVEKHAARFSKTINTAVGNTRQLLSLIRDSIKKNGSASEEALKTVNNLWQELEQLFEAANEAKSALPQFMEQQKENMSLYHSSTMNEMLRDSQTELNLQNKKVNIQHSLILEHQQAFQDYKARTDSKMSELSELQDRVTRLQMEQGLFKTEITTYKHLLDNANERHDVSAETTHALRKELDATQISNKQLDAQNVTLRATIGQLQEKVKTAEHLLTVAKKDLAQKDTVLGEEIQKHASLQTTIMALQNGDRMIKDEFEALNMEYKKLQDKLANQSAEHSKIFSKSSGQENEIGSLMSELATLKQENNGIKSQLQRLGELEKSNSLLSGAKNSLEKQVEDLKARADAFDKKSSDAEKRVQSLLGKIKNLDKEKDELEIENDDLSGKVVKHEKVAADLKALKEHNVTLQAALEKSQQKTVATATGHVDDGAIKTLQEKLRASEERATHLATALEEWTELAKRSYEEYKEMLPLYKQTEKHRDDCLEKDKEIANLQLQLQTAKGPKQSNGTQLTGDAGYWKRKYDLLLESTER